MIGASDDVRMAEVRKRMLAAGGIETKNPIATGPDGPKFTRR